LGRRYRLLFITDLPIEKFYKKLREFYLSEGYRLIEERSPSYLAFEAGSKFYTYVMGTMRWEKALRKVFIELSSTKGGSNAQIMYDVSWLTTIPSIVKASRLEVARLKKKVKPKDIRISFK